MKRGASEELIARLNRDGAALAARFGLRYRAIEAEPPRVKRRYGVCYSDGTIRIRLRHAATGEPLKYSSLVNTLCHELAHLAHFNHGLRFQRFYRQILEYARVARIYLPGPDPERASGRLVVPPPRFARAARASQGSLAAAGRIAHSRSAPVPPRQLSLF